MFTVESMHRAYLIQKNDGYILIKQGGKEFLLKETFEVPDKEGWPISYISYRGLLTGYRYKMKQI